LDNFITSYNSHIDKCCHQLQDQEQLEDAIRNAFSMVSIRLGIERDRQKKLKREMEMEMERKESKTSLYVKQRELLALQVTKQEELNILLQNELSVSKNERRTLANLIPKKAIGFPTYATDQQMGTCSQSQLEKNISKLEICLQRLDDDKANHDVMRHDETHTRSSGTPTRPFRPHAKSTLSRMPRST
jgi:hypothetical protein